MHAEPSPSLLLYLFADKLVPVVPFKLGLPLHLPQTILCKNVLVEQVRLAEMLFAVAFWSLREQGALLLQTYAARKMLVMPTIAVRVNLCHNALVSAASSSSSAPPVGLEAAIRNALGSGQDGTNVHAIIRAIAKGGDENPHAMFVHRTAYEATTVGLLQSGTQGHHLPSDIDCARVSPLEARADEVLARWRAFESGEPALHHALLKSCASGIKSLREEPRPGVPPGAFSA